MSKAQKYQLILASSSPRRKELLDKLLIPYRILAPEIDETLNSNLSLIDQCKYLAKLKAHAAKKSDNDRDLVLTKNPNRGFIYLAADTLVEIEQQILEKPRDLNDARAMLTKLSGRTHRVVTGIHFHYIKDQKNWIDFSTHAESKVTFHPLSQSIIDYYLSTGDSLDKAGAYGIQGMAQSFIKGIEGTFANVVGLPLDLIVQFFEQNIKSEDTSWYQNIVS